MGLRVWVERAGRAVLGPGRLELLEAIARLHSISAAAREMGMSYRHAWVLVQSINEAAGEPLVTAATGGRGGGGARLTDRGRQAVAALREVTARLGRVAGGPGPDPSVIHLAAAVSLEEVVGRLLADYAQLRPAVRVRAVFGASDELADHLLAGAPGDLFLTADPGQIDRLAVAGFVCPEDRRALAENGLAAVGPADCDVRVRSAADLAGPRLALAEPGCPLGGYTRAYLERAGLYDALAPRAVRAENSRAVVAAVRAGLADVGIVYASDAARAEGCRLLFRVKRLPVPIRYAAARIDRGGDPRSARDLLEFLASGPAAERFRACGFLPVKPT